MKFSGKIIRGFGQGRKIGFPTVNVEGDFTGLSIGVYGCEVELSGHLHKGVLHFGPVSFKEGDKSHLEIYLLDFDEEVYGVSVKFEVLFKIRNVMRFDSLEALSNQIAKDVEVFKKTYSRN